MGFKNNLKKLGKKFNEASMPKKAGIIGAGAGAVVFFHHFLIAGAIGGTAGYFGGKAYQKNKNNGPQQ